MRDSGQRRRRQRRRRLRSKARRKRLRLGQRQSVSGPGQRTQGRGVRDQGRGVRDPRRGIVTDPGQDVTYTLLHVFVVPPRLADGYLCSHHRFALIIGRFDICSVHGPSLAACRQSAGVSTSRCPGVSRWLRGRRSATRSSTSAGWSASTPRSRTAQISMHEAVFCGIVGIP